ncbi:G5 domain-containing protein [Staphylococcus massiliensis]|uniref:Putative protease n=1 Tax=Staphylococcus massiliensis S46 TaxID=1229783 RepID=K9ASK8_9STAP|nr:G5 domain-containing protein [Staphylococcus massiliensis]EKU49061.1 putative protease [Staphylococcus massiliensis S46]
MQPYKHKTIAITTSTIITGIIYTGVYNQTAQASETVPSTSADTNQASSTTPISNDTTTTIEETGPVTVESLNNLDLPTASTNVDNPATESAIDASNVASNIPTTSENRGSTPTASQGYTETNQAMTTSTAPSTATRSTHDATTTSTPAPRRTARSVVSDPADATLTSNAASSTNTTSGSNNTAPTSTTNTTNATSSLNNTATATRSTTATTTPTTTPTTNTTTPAPTPVAPPTPEIHTVKVDVADDWPSTRLVSVTRGTLHIRQNLGYVVPANTNVYVRSTKVVPGKSLQLDLIAHGNKEDKSLTFSLNNQWHHFNAPANAALFLRTPHDPNLDASIEYYIENDNKIPMPHYYYGGDKAQFDQEWERSQAPFALVESEDVKILVPLLDREFVKNLAPSDPTSSANAFDQNLDYYKNILTKYDEWLGLDNSNEFHRDNKQQYFVRPDKTGYGVAYYSTYYAGTNSTHVTPYFQKGWLVLHEVGHGYDGFITKTIAARDIGLIEVWNNIFANLYVSTVDRTHADWLYHGDQNGYQARELATWQAANGNYTYTDMGLPQRLNVMATLVRGTGVQGFIDFNKSLRENASTVRVTALNDTIAENWGGVSNYNIVPYLEMYGIYINDHVRERIFSKNHSILHHLALMVKDPSERERIRQEHQMKTVYDLISTEAISSSGITGSNTVTLNLNGHTLRDDAVVHLMDKNRIVATAPVVNQTATFTNVPVGAYKISAPFSETGALPNTNVIIVSDQDSTPVTLDYPALDEHMFSNKEEVLLKGLSDLTFASMIYDPSNKTLEIDDRLRKPHDYYGLGKYASIRVKSPDGTIKYERDFIGNVERKGMTRLTTLNIEHGDLIEIYHAEPGSRFAVVDYESRTEVPRLDSSKKNTTYVMTEYGLEVPGKPAPFPRVYQSIEQELNQLRADMAAHPENDYRKQTAAIYHDLQYFEPEVRNVLIETYKDAFVNVELIEDLKKPVVTNPENDVIYAGERTLTLEGTPGSTITVTIEDTQTSYTAVVGDNGIATIETDSNLNLARNVIVTASKDNQTTPPKTYEVKPVVLTSATTELFPNTDKINLTGTPGTTLQAYKIGLDGSRTLLNTFKVPESTAETTDFEFPFTAPLNPGESIYITAGNNMGDDFLADVVSIVSNTGDIHDNELYSGSDPITVLTKPNTTVSLLDQSNQVIGTATSNADGTVTITPTRPLVTNEDVYFSTGEGDAAPTYLYTVHANPITTSTEVLPFDSVYQAHPNLDEATGNETVLTEGANGERVTETNTKLQTTRVVSETAPTSKVIGVDNVRVTETTVPFITRYEGNHDTLITAPEVVREAGANGLTTTTETYVVDPSTGALSAPSSSTTTVDPTTKVIEVGTKEVIETEIPYATIRRYNANLNFGAEQVVTEGTVGTLTTTRIYDVNPNTGERINPTDQTTEVAPVERVVEYGPSAFDTRYEAMPNEDAATGATTVVTPGQNGDLQDSDTSNDPVIEVIGVDNVAVVVTDVPFNTVYQADDARLITEEDIVSQEGANGSTTEKTIYDVDPATGSLTNPNVTTTNVSASDKIVLVGTKEVIVTDVPFATIRRYNANLNVGAEQVVTEGTVGTLTSTRIYDVNPNTGERINPTDQTTEVAPVNRVVEYGPSAFDTRYEAMPNEDAATGATTVITPGQNGDLQDSDTSNDPVPEVIGVDNIAVVMTDVPFNTVYQADDARLITEENVVSQEGANGSTIEKTIYDVDPATGSLTNPNVTTTNVSATDKIVLVGTKEVIVTDVPFTTVRRYNANLDVGAEQVVIEGTVGTLTTTRLYDVNPNTGERINPTEQTSEVAPVDRVVEYGPSAFDTRYEALPNEDEKVGSTTIIQAGQNGDAQDSDASNDPIVQIIGVDNQSQVTATLKFNTVYEADTSKLITEPDLVKQQGVDGSTTTITTYDVNADTGELSNPTVQTHTVDAVDHIVVVGAKEVHVTEIPFKTERRVNKQLAEGVEQVVQEGRVGSVVETVIYQVDPRTGARTEATRSSKQTDAIERIVEYGEAVVKPEVVEPNVPLETEKPAEESKPDAPVEAEKPGEDVTPEAQVETNQPSEEVKPEVPGEAEQPTEAGKPEKPVEEPAKPEVPVEESKPSETVQPEVPVKTEKPSEGVTPEAPGETEKPSEQVKPEDPAKNNQPTEETKPEANGNTEQPTEAETPDQPKEDISTTEKPSETGTPEQPTKPETPKDKVEVEQPKEPQQPIVDLTKPDEETEETEIPSTVKPNMCETKTPLKPVITQTGLTQEDTTSNLVHPKAKFVSPTFNQVTHLTYNKEHVSFSNKHIKNNQESLPETGQTQSDKTTLWSLLAFVLGITFIKSRRKRRQ